MEPVVTRKRGRTAMRRFPHGKYSPDRALDSPERPGGGLEERGVDAGPGIGRNP